MQASDIDHFTYTTLGKFARFKVVDLRASIQNYVAAQKLIQEKKITVEGGDNIELRVKTGTASSAKFSGLYQADTLTVEDQFTSGVIPWRHLTSHWIYDVREPSMNRGPQAIVDIVASRRNDSKFDHLELFEEGFWGKPATSSDTLTIWGIKMFMVMNSSTGFNGGNPTGFSDCAGISSSTVPAWSNYTFQYAAVTPSDLIKKARKAQAMCNWRGLVPEPSEEKPESRGLYMTYDTLALIQDLATAQNDNLGRDVAKYAGGQVMVGGTPCTWVAYLDDDSTDPIYGIDWGALELVTLRGHFLRETPPKPLTGIQHDTRVAYLDTTINLRPINRRRLWCAYI